MRTAIVALAVIICSEAVAQDPWPERPTTRGVTLARPLDCAALSRGTSSCASGLANTYARILGAARYCGAPTDRVTRLDAAIDAAIRRVSRTNRDRDEALRAYQDISAAADYRLQAGQERIDCTALAARFEVAERDLGMR